MHSQGPKPDFVLFPSHPDKHTEMLALESSRHQHPSYFQQFTMDPTLVDPFGIHMDSFNAYGQNQEASRVPQSYYDTPALYAESGSDLPKEQPMPTLSSASGPSIASASSSAIGSPYSGTAHTFQETWVDTNHGLGLQAAVVGDLFPSDFMGSTLDTDSGFYQEKFPDSFVDPSLIQPMPRQPNFSPPTISYPDQPNYSIVQSGFVPQSPITSPLPTTEPYFAENSHLSQHLHITSPSLMPSGPHSRPVSIYDRRSSISSTQSRRSQPSPVASSVEIDEETREKGRCPHPECGRVFKDLKAHMLTHQSERPEKCPIVTCEYHTKGFARKYDKNRHTLTHYKGTMVCGFCPGSGSPAEKSFNRADVFKRHLTSVHGVEQTPPNCRKRSPTASSNKKVSSYCNDATGKCSTCSATFSNAQDFYEHLDDCVLRVVQQEEPSEAINQRRLAEVASDEEVKKTMEKHMLLDTAGTVDQFDDDDDYDDNDDSTEPSSATKWHSGRRSFKSTKINSNSRPILGSNNAVTKHSNTTNSKSRPTASRRRNNRDNYPQSWGCPSSSMKTKKRVLCVFDGQRRLWKDEMMLDNEFEVRVKLPGGAGDGTNREAYVTDLDVETLKRAEGVLNANDEERGPWDGQSRRLIGQPAILLPDMSQQHDDEVDIEELIS